MFYNAAILGKNKQNLQNFLFKDTIYAKAGPAWVIPKIKPNFSTAIRRDHKLSRTSHLIKIQYVLTKL